VSGSARLLREPLVKWIPEFARKQKEALGSVRLQGTRVEASTLTLERFGKVHVSRSADYCKPSTHGHPQWLADQRSRRRIFHSPAPGDRVMYPPIFLAGRLGVIAAQP
jgi:hypothetical protein